MKRLFTLSEVILIAALLMFTCKPAMAQHYMTLNWTKVANPVAGAYINVYRGTSAGAEGANPINSQPIGIALTTWQDDTVIVNGKYFYVIKQCAIDVVSGLEVCSAPSNEASNAIQLKQPDLSSPTVLTATPH